MKADSHKYKNYLLGVLLVVTAFNFVDLNALALVSQDIKVDLQLSDTQLGFMTGIAFAFFYSIMGLPIARWADRGNRVVIIATTTALWSLAVALSGIAGSFGQLLLIRTCVAVGEAGCKPPTHSLIADYFNRAERPRAMAILMLSSSLSMFVGSFVGGWLNELYGWRVMFLCLGLPGLALAALVRFTLREPRNDAVSMLDATGTVTTLQSGDSSPAPSQLRMGEVCKALWRNYAFRNILLAFAVTSLFANGIGQWQAVYLIRRFGMTTGELGSWLTAVGVTSTLAGTYLGGTLASRYATNNELLQITGVAVGYLVFGCTSALTYMTANKFVALALIGLGGFGGALTLAPLYATMQSLVPARMRAVSIAIVNMFSNLIGLGFGPLTVGALSDHLRPWVGEESLRYALLAVCPGYLWGAWHLWRATRTIARDVANAEQDQDGALLIRPDASEVEKDLHVSQAQSEAAVLLGARARD